MIDKLIKAENKIKELEEANHKLKEINYQKNEFVSLATHQIRGPLGAIKGYVSLMLEGDYGPVPEGLTEPLNVIFKSTESLNKTVNDFLDVSRIDQGQMRYYMKDFDLRDLVNEAVRELSGPIKSNGLELRLNITNSPCLVHDDKAKLKHVLTNLIDNANKYTKSGWIEVGLKKKSNNRILFSVKDSGVGIKKEIMPLLFQKFSRSPDANKENIQGTGLGLYIAKKMMEAQNGRIWAESEGQSKGSQFYVEIPSV